MLILGRTARLMRHIFARLQRTQESHDIRLAGPSSSRPSHFPSRQRRERSLFRGEISLGVDVGGVERHVSEPSTDGIDVYARLKEMSSCGMANDVGTDPFSLQRRYRGTQLCDIAFDECVNAITRQRLSATVHEQVRLDGTLPYKLTKVPKRDGPERAAALLVSFTRDPNGFGVPVDVTDPEGSCFADASTRVVKEQQQRLVAPSLG